MPDCKNYAVGFYITLVGFNSFNAVVLNINIVKACAKAYLTAKGYYFVTHIFNNSRK